MQQLPHDTKIHESLLQITADVCAKSPGEGDQQGRYGRLRLKQAEQCQRMLVNSTKSQVYDGPPPEDTSRSK
eukprot:scaffold180063_cov18-Prasinocladus_malaysianus.AAC.2